MMRDLSRWMWLSIRPGQARRPFASKTCPSAARAGSIAAMRPSLTPISRGACSGRSERRALRIMRSMRQRPFRPSDQCSIGALIFVQVELSPEDLLNGLERIHDRAILHDPVVPKSKEMRGKEAHDAPSRLLRRV